MTRKNLDRYYQAWVLRQEGKKLREIAGIMNLSIERVRLMATYIALKIKCKKPLSKKLKGLIERLNSSKMPKNA